MPVWYTEYATSVDAGEPFYRHCPSCGAATLPPRTICPECGNTSLEERPLSRSASVESVTEIHVTTPEFDGETPYSVVLARFDEGVRLTGQLRGAETVALDEPVRLGTEWIGDQHPILTFEPETSNG